MKTNHYDIVVAKEFESKNGETTEKRTVWNKVGRAWPTRSADSMNFELFLIPGQRYVINMKTQKPQSENRVDFENFDASKF